MANLTIICGKWLSCKIKQDSMKKLTIIAVIVSFLMISGCAARQTSLLLNDVESYIMERPDSALAVLDTMDRAHLSTDRLKAHHALLHAMALDKNYIDVTDDSLASVALSYYSRKGPEKYEARAQYYLGLSYYYAGDYNKAILEFTKAEKIAERSDSLYWGMVNGMLGTVYTKSHNDNEALRYTHKAYEIYSSLNATYYIDVTEFKLAKSYFNVNMISKADSILQKLINRSDLNSSIKVAILSDYAFIKVTQPEPDYKIALEMYNTLMCKNNFSLMTRKDYWVYSYLLSYFEKHSEADNLISQLKKTDTSATANYWLYRINKSKGLLSDALSELGKSTTKNNTEVTEALKQSLALTQKDYYESQFREASLQIRVKNQMFIIVIILSVLIILVIILGVQKYMTKQKHEKEKLLEYAEEINRQLSQYKDENYPMLKKRFISLYKSRFETLGTLCNQYLQDRNRDDIEKVMFQKVMLLIEDIRNDNVRKANFESVLDTELDGIMTRFRNEIPKCKEWEVTMFGYLVAGFDSTTISRLMDFSLDQVYSYKRRLIQKIQTKKPEHSTQFLEMLT